MEDSILAFDNTIFYLLLSSILDRGCAMSGKEEWRYA
jgi:hypothetical protein